MAGVIIGKIIMLYTGMYLFEKWVWGFTMGNSLAFFLDSVRCLVWLKKPNYG